MTKGNPIYDWRDELKPGDILRTKAGKYRVLMQVDGPNRYWSKLNKCSYYVAPRANWFWFYIKACSWTNSCYTLMSRERLKQSGMTPTGENIYGFKKMYDEFVKNICKGASCCVGKSHL